MKRVLRWAGVGVLAVLVAIQFVPVDRSNPAVEADLSAPAAVEQLLRAACYDCHSFETRWPWYGYIAPVSWLIARDVENGRSELLFSEWGLMSSRERNHLREEIWEEVEEGEMPLLAYRALHARARLSAADLELLRGWTGSVESE
jgi:hypothetical protein